MFIASEDLCSCRAFIVWVGQDGESEHADDLHVDEVEAVGGGAKTGQARKSLTGPP